MREPKAHLRPEVLHTRLEGVLQGLQLVEQLVDHLVEQEVEHLVEQEVQLGEELEQVLVDHQPLSPICPTWVPTKDQTPIP